MGESILNALMHLFAIVANTKEEGVTGKGRIIVESFLSRYVNSDIQDEYLRLFENYSEFYRREMHYQAMSGSRNADILSLTEASKVCNKVKAELIQEERLLVLLRLMEFVYEDKMVSESEFEFISIVAENFKIPRLEFINCLAFVWGDTVDEFDKSKFLIIDNKVTEWSDNLSWFMKKEPKKRENETKHMYCENLYGRVIVMYTESVNLLVFKYEGQLNLYLEGNKILSDKTYQLGNGSIIKGPNIKSIYYSDVAAKFMKEESQEKSYFQPKTSSLNFVIQTMEFINLIFRRKVDSLSELWEVVE